MKKTVGVLVMFLLVFSLLAIAQEESSENLKKDNSVVIKGNTCSGFWGWLSCLLVGDSSKRSLTAQGWFSVTSGTGNTKETWEEELRNQNGQVIARQDIEQFGIRKMTVLGEEVQLSKKGTNVLRLRDLKSVKSYDSFGEKDEIIGNVQIGETEIIVTNFDQETQKIFSENGVLQNLRGDYYKTSGKCKSKLCFVPNGGTWTKDVSGEPVNYVLQYNYDNYFGADRKLEKVNLYDTRGDLVGSAYDVNNDNKPDILYIEQPDGSINKLDFKTGLHMITYTEKKGSWVDKDGNKLGTEELARVEASRRSSFQKGFGGALASIYSITSNIKSYPSISKLLFGEADSYKSWQSSVDKAFAPALGSTWFPSAICEALVKWKDNVPEGGKLVIRTTGDAPQTVASIQAEKSAQKSPILCHINEDQEDNEQWVCDKGQTCVDEKFCHTDGEDKPLLGWFYKITWAVSAPRDDALTLYKDENGVAVSFNVWIFDKNVDDGIVKGFDQGGKPLYNQEGNLISPKELQNGASDKDVFLKYSDKDYEEVCIIWHQPPESVNLGGVFNPEGSSTPASNVCFDIVTSSKGEIEWQAAGQTSSSSSSTSERKGEVTKNTNW